MNIGEDDVVDVRPPFRPISRDAPLAVEVPLPLQQSQASLREAVVRKR